MTNAAKYLLLRQQSSTVRIKKGVTYVAPSSVKIERYATQVCQRLGHDLNPDYDSIENRQELAGFIKVVTHIYAKHLTKQAQRGNPSGSGNNASSSENGRLS